MLDLGAVALAGVAEAAAAGDLDDQAVARHQGEVDLGRQTDVLAVALDRVAGRRAGLAAEQAPGRDAEAVGVAVEGHLVVEDAVDAPRAETAAALAGARRAAPHGVLLDHHEGVVLLEGFDRHVGAVADVAVDHVGAVAVGRGAPAAAHHLEIDPVAVGPHVAHADGVGGVVARGQHLFGHHRGHGQHDGVVDALAGAVAGAHRDRLVGIEEAALGHDHLDRSVEPVVDRDIAAAEQQGEGAVDRRDGRGERRVDDALGLRRAARQVDRDGVALHRHLGPDPERFVGEAVVVDEVLGLVHPVGNGGDGGARQALGIVQQVLGGGQHGVFAEALQQLDETGLAGVVGGQLGVEVAQHQVGRAHVEADELLQHAVAEVLLEVELEQGDTQALGVDIDGAGVGPGGAAADVDVVAERGAERHQLVVVEHRREDQDVVQVLAAAVRVVGDEPLAWLDFREIVALGEGLEDQAEGVHVDRAELGLGDDPTLTVEKRGRAVAGLADDGGIGRAHHHLAHLLGHGVEAVADDVEACLIDVAPLGHHPSPRSRTRAPAAPTVARQPGGTRVVAVGSSMMARPSRAKPAGRLSRHAKRQAARAPR